MRCLSWLLFWPRGPRVSGYSHHALTVRLAPCQPVRLILPWQYGICLEETTQA
jgi:hypothetical protein